MRGGLSKVGRTVLHRPSCRDSATKVTILSVPSKVLDELVDLNITYRILSYGCAKTL